jgi:hypothetical protein
LPGKESKETLAIMNFKLSFKKTAAILILLFIIALPFLGVLSYGLYIRTIHFSHLDKLYYEKNKNEILQICGKPLEAFKETEVMNSYLNSTDIEFYKIFPAGKVTKKNLPPIEDETFLYEVDHCPPYFMLIYFDKSKKVKYIIWGNG